MGNIYPTLPTGEYFRRDLTRIDIASKDTFISKFSSDISDEKINLLNDITLNSNIIDLTDGFASLMDVVTGIVDAMGGFKGILLLVSSIAVSKLQPNIAQAINTGIDKVKNFKLSWDHVGESVSKAKDLIAVTTSRKRLDTRIEKRDLGAKAETQEERAY
jgi:predicted butyrate kinase (DUF1464 family)